MSKESSEMISVNIPKKIFENIKKRIEGTDFDSVSSYIAYVLDEILNEIDDETNDKFSEEDEEKVKERLKALGYLD
jgi:Arc/MetJ-type ribon-helix-helix transcriptional regulator